LPQGNPPEQLDQLRLDLGTLGESGRSLPLKADIYNPWTDRWSEVKFDGQTLVLPEFSRSLVVRLVLPQ